MEDPLLVVGRIRKPHGIRGEIFVWLETDHPEAVFRPGRTVILGDAEGTPDGSTLTIDRARPFKGGMLIQTREHATRTESLEALRGRSLLIPRSEVAPLAEDEVFYHDLVGLRVVAGGDTIGKVREIYEGAGGDLVVVQREQGGEVLVPFVREVVQRIDVEGGVMEIDPPAGLLDL